ncbi:MAG TPA: hypothetical protein VGA69_01375 [Nitriliruptorales bacterium]
MRRSPLSLYTPLLIIVLVQALIIAVAPSRAPQPSIDDGGFVAAAPGTTGTDGTTGTGTTGTTGTDTADTTGSTSTGTDGSAGGSAASTGGSGSTTGSSTTGSSTTGGSTTGDSTTGDSTTGDTGREPAVEGDTSHCSPDGRQHGVTYHAPPCAPKWEGGDNGGATYRGVTQDTVKVVYFRENKNEQVTALLNQYGLRATRAEDEQFMDAAEDFVNEHYESYGREIDFEIFDATNCPETPPDIPACRAEAKRALAETDPFMILWPAPIYPDVYDEFTREGVIAVGGWHFDNSYFAGRRPYRYDVFMDGTRSADVISEYVCKKLATKNATHAGRIIHPSFPAGGARDGNERRFGIIVPEFPGTLMPAQRAAESIRGCGSEVFIYGYPSDITQARQQSQATITAMIDDGVTSAICMCDPIAPVFRTQAASENNYYPEWVMPGLGLLDYDLLGRLYEKRQMAHAFGPSHLQLFPPHAQSDSSKVWRASGREGNACASCNLNTSYFLMAAAMIQAAGPNLTPATVEQGMLTGEPRGGWAQTGGDETVVLQEFGQDDYTLISDFKEVFWREDAISRVDGRPGAFVAMYAGERWKLGELPSVFEVPQPTT